MASHWVSQQTLMLEDADVESSVIDDETKTESAEPHSVRVVDNLVSPLPLHDEEDQVPLVGGKAAPLNSKQDDSTAVNAWRSDGVGINGARLSSSGRRKSQSRASRDRLAEGIVDEFRKSEFLKHITDRMQAAQESVIRQSQAEVAQLRTENGQLRAQYMKSSMELPTGVSQPDGIKHVAGKSATTKSPEVDMVEEKTMPSTSVSLMATAPSTATAGTATASTMIMMGVDTPGKDRLHPYDTTSWSVPIDKDAERVRFRKSVATASRAVTCESKRAYGRSLQSDWHDGRSPVMADADYLKQEVRKAVLRPPYSVFQYYKKDGIMQKIAKNPYFEYISLSVIAINSIWLWIDIDYNRCSSDSCSLSDADTIFQFMEYFFLGFFLTEWIIRFAAFRYKRDGLNDAWFVFDSILVVLMVFDTLIMATVSAFFTTGTAKASDTNILKLFRMFRISRMARMARLLKALPELTILIKGIWVAARSVFFTLCLLGLLIYVFAVAFRQLTDGTSIGEQYFRSVPYAMKALLLYATLPDWAPMVDNVGAEHIVLGAVLLIFVLLGSLTVMNMLVGVLVEVVSVVSAVEKEEMMVSFVKRQLQEMLSKSGLDADEDMMISRREFEMLLVKPQAAKVIQDVGVDPVGLVDFSDYIFADAEEEKLTFSEFIALVLQLRGSNTPTVKDVVDLRKVLLQEMAGVNLTLQTVIDSIYKLPGAEELPPLSCRKTLYLSSCRPGQLESCLPGQLESFKPGVGSSKPGQLEKPPPSAVPEQLEADTADLNVPAKQTQITWADASYPPSKASFTQGNFHQVVPGQANGELPRFPSKHDPHRPSEENPAVLHMITAT